MLRAAQQTLRAHTRSARPALVLRPFSSSTQLDFSSTRSRHTGDAGEPLPWFVDPSTAPTSSPIPSTSSTLATAPVPTPPPSHLPAPLHPLHAYLSTSPFLDKHSIKYIHAREADPAGSWCDWVVVASLREGRERGLRGAMDGVKRFVRAPSLPLTRPLTFGRRTVGKEPRRARLPLLLPRRPSRIRPRLSPLPSLTLRAPLRLPHHPRPPHRPLPPRPPSRNQLHPRRP